MKDKCCRGERQCCGSGSGVGSRIIHFGFGSEQPLSRMNLKQNSSETNHSGSTTWEGGRVPNHGKKVKANAQIPVEKEVMIIQIMTKSTLPQGQIKKEETMRKKKAQRNANSIKRTFCASLGYIWLLRENTIKKSSFFFFVLYSALLHLPPLRFHCADRCWDRTQDRCNWCIGSQTL